MTDTEYVVEFYLTEGLIGMVHAYRFKEKDATYFQTPPNNVFLTKWGARRHARRIIRDIKNGDRNHLGNWNHGAEDSITI